MIGFYECPFCGYLYEQDVDLDIKTELEIHDQECIGKIPTTIYL